jgi:hypothetical protein
MTVQVRLPVHINCIRPESSSVVEQLINIPGAFFLSNEATVRVITLIMSRSQVRILPLWINNCITSGVSVTDKHS